MYFDGIGEEIKKERKRAGLSQKQLAERLGVTHALIGQYERGERHPKLETIQRIASALGVNEMKLAPVSGLSTGEEKLRAKEAFFKKMWDNTAQGPAAIELKKEHGEYSLRIPEYQPLPKVVELLNDFDVLPALKQEIEAIESKN